MLKLKKLIRIGTSKKPLKIIVLGARQSGKTTFFTVAYHNTLEKIGHKIKPVGSTIERVRKKMRELKNDKIKPTPIGKKEVYNFEFFKDGKENSHQLHFDWLDIAGEYCDFDSEREIDAEEENEFYENIKESDGCCLIIDSEKLMNNKLNSDNIEYLCQQISHARKWHRSMKINRKSYPLAIVYTKTDLLKALPKEVLIEKLNEKAKVLINQTSGTAYERAIFTTKLFRQTDEIQSEGQLPAMIWLVQNCKKNCGIISATQSLITNPINSFSKE